MDMLQTQSHLMAAVACALLDETPPVPNRQDHRFAAEASIIHHFA